MLWRAGLPDEDAGETADSFGLSAADIGDYILNSALLKYNKSFENLEFITGDNCSSVNKLLVEGITDWYRTNKNIDRVLPLVGCASHRLNLAVQRLWKKEIDPYHDIVKAVHALHVSLRSVKNNFKLAAAKCQVTPQIEQETRWSSCYKMMKLFFETLPMLNEGGFDRDTRLLFLSGPQIEEARELLNILEDVQSVSQELQRGDPEKNNLYTARLLFDNLIKDYPRLGFEIYVGINSQIVHDRAFESAMVKLQGPVEVALTLAEKDAVKVFKETAGDSSTDVREERQNESYAQKVLREASEKRSKKKSKNGEYRAVLHVSSNSNICERLFSGNMLVMSDQRKCMDPSTLETVTILD